MTSRIRRSRRIRQSLLAIVVSILLSLSISACATTKAWTADDEITRTDEILDHTLREMAANDARLTPDDQLRARAIRLAMLLSTASFYIYLQDPEVRSAIIHAAEMRHLELLRSYQERHREELKNAPTEQDSTDSSQSQSRPPRTIKDNQ